MADVRGLGNGVERIRVPPMPRVSRWTTGAEHKSQHGCGRHGAGWVKDPQAGFKCLHERTAGLGRCPSRRTRAHTQPAGAAAAANLLLLEGALVLCWPRRGSSP